MKLLTGYKTYTLAIVTLIYAASAYYTGHMSGMDALNLVLAALGASSIRHAISTSIATPPSTQS